MKKYFAIGILALVGALSLGCFIACDEAGNTGNTGNTDGTNYNPNKNSHLLREGETVCEHCGEQLFEGELRFTLSDNQKYYKVSDFGNTSGDVVVPDFFCSRGADTYLPVLELSGNTGDKVESLEIPAVAEECKIYSGKGLKEIRVAAGNSHYAAENGVLYNDTRIELLVYPAAKGGTFSVPASVKKIGSRAFADCESLRSVVIPAGVETLGESAFSSSGITSVEFAQGSVLKTVGDSAFINCESLRSVVIPAGVETLGENAFENSGVTSVEFAQGSVLNIIGDSAFANCDNLQTVEIPASVETLGESAFSSSGVTSVEFAQGSALKTIGEEAFYRCEKLHSIVIPAGVTEIRFWAFYSCSALQSVAIPAGVTEIGEGAFGFCTSLTSVEFAADSVLKTIGDAAFMFCNSIEQIVIPASVENMGEQVFDSWGWHGQQRICVPFAADNLPAGWSAEWSSGIIYSGVRIEYNYTGN